MTRLDLAVRSQDLSITILHVNIITFPKARQNNLLIRFYSCPRAALILKVNHCLLLVAGKIPVYSAEGSYARQHKPERHL